ncbi:MAG TPA: hypothetical protein VFH73_00240 [Polyangia bacterium]|jgi:hypothetical protein|nr:hypothetical protein [Polyangia bacterium]
MRTHLLAMAALLAAATASCMENEALRVDGGAPDGGDTAAGGNSVGGRGGVAGGGGAGMGGGIGGAGGPVGKGGSGGAVMCPPVCDIFCANGNVRDANGCELCKCNPPPACQPVACKLGCPNGYKKDGNGCDTCACNPPPNVCPALGCLPMCAYGTKKDANGCETCQCNPAPTCSKDSCGPAPGAPNYICPDGSVAGPVCTADANGKCGWKFVDCATVCPGVACANFCPNGHLKDGKGCDTCACAPVSMPGACASYGGDFASCNKDPACGWLAPGCGQPALAAEGCYARSDLGCGSTGVCSAGKTCVKRVIDPCGSNPLSGIRCAACGVIETICL